MTVDDTNPAAARTDDGSSRGSRIAGGAFSALGGAIYGTVGTVAHQNVVRIGDLVLPVGLVLALLGALALMLSFRLLFESRLSVLWLGIGMVGVIALFSVPSAGGSVLIPEGVLGLAWTVVPVLFATIVVAWPRMPQRPLARAGGNTTTNGQPNLPDRPEA